MYCRYLRLFQLGLIVGCPTQLPKFQVGLGLPVWGLIVVAHIAKDSLGPICYVVSYEMVICVIIEGLLTKITV